MSVRLTLPEPPSVNRYWRVFRNRAVMSDDARLYKRRVALLGRRHLQQGPVAVSLRWFRSRRAGDLDNRVKVTLDALNGVLWTDDDQVVELHAYRAEDKANPRMEVTVEAA